jgi:hypothetical protein
MTKKIAIQDANIMIDLIKTGLFDYCLALDFNFSTTNLILNELYDEQVTSMQTHISSGKFPPPLVCSAGKAAWRTNNIFVALYLIFFLPIILQTLLQLLVRLAT